ncbi:MAG: UDP-glucose 4-epimerase GalE [Alphaproteobacteria bacterium]|nr:UDP-glucose 4-epimerase GalE [Alphaproteobacteria bacterium]MDE2501069.1 UDP-glucose 4-epimerase GalE [Alphaproteobacteria bacterium]
MQLDPSVVLVSGGAGYIGSHAVHVLKTAGFTPVVIDSLVNGNLWATRGASAFRKGDIGDAGFVRTVCDEFRPVAALHFAAFIEVGESVKAPEKYFTNNREKAKVFFDTLAGKGVRNVVFSSTAAVYGEVTESAPIREDRPTRPVNPYGQSKLDAETHLRSITGVNSVALRYFNVAGAEPDAGLGEAHFPETHLIPRIVLPLIDAPEAVQSALGLATGFKIFGTDYPTRDGTAVRDYIHVMDLADAHVRALRYLLEGGKTDVFNLGSGAGYSVKEIVEAARTTLKRSDFKPGVELRREGDPATLIADSTKARDILSWRPERGVEHMIDSAAAWHRSPTYTDTILKKATIASS